MIILSSCLFIGCGYLIPVFFLAVLYPPTVLNDINTSALTQTTCLRERQLLGVRLDS